MNGVKQKMWYIVTIVKHSSRIYALFCNELLKGSRKARSMTTPRPVNAIVKYWVMIMESK